MKKIFNNVIAFFVATVIFIIIDFATNGLISDGIWGYVSVVCTVLIAVSIADFLDKRH